MTMACGPKEYVDTWNALIDALLDEPAFLIEVRHSFGGIPVNAAGKERRLDRLREYLAKRRAADAIIENLITFEEGEQQK